MFKLGMYSAENRRIARENEGEEVGVTEEVVEAAAAAEVEGGEVTSQVEVMAESPAEMEELSDAYANTVDAEEEGGLTPVEAAALESQVRSIARRLGVEHRPFRKRNAFESAGSRMSATRQAREGIWDTIKKAWKALKDFIVGLYRKATSFLRNQFSGADSLKSNAEDLKTTVSNLKTDKPEKVAFEDQSLADALFFGGKAGSVATVVTATIDAMSFAAKKHGAFKTFADKVNDQIKAIEDALKNKDKDDKRTDDERNKEVADLVATFAGELVKGGGAKPSAADVSGIPGVMENGTTLKGLLHNQSLLVVMSKAEDGQMPHIEVKLAKPAAGGDKSATVRAGDKGTLTSICEEVVKLAGSIKDTNKQVGEMEAFQSQLEGLISRGIKAADSIGNDASKETVKSLTRIKGVIATIGSSYVRMMTISAQLGSPTGKAALSYVKKSVACYGKKED